MRKTLLLPAALLLALAACGKKQPAPVATDPPGAAEPAGAAEGEEPVAQLESAQTVLPDPHTTDIADLPRAISLDNDLVKADITFDEGVFAYAPAMAMDLVEDARIRLTATEEDAAAYKEADPDYFRPYGLRIDWKLTGAAGGLAGLEGFQYSYTGGAHGNYFTDGRIYSTITGDELRLADLFTDPAAAIAAQMAPIHEGIAREKVFKTNNSAAYDTFLGEAQDAVTPDMVKGGQISLIASDEAGKLGGYVIHFGPYEIGSYAEGAYHVAIPQEDFRDFLKPEYTGAFGGKPVALSRPDSKN
ncbi:MAG: hypothetical protein R3C13_14225 [Hyphomonas sp.]|uniref:DUF3298 and DUF4163 domain-containing protein n=1 Tax=Hyphomonas sp. TaxID=87 RepID=UPI00352747AA